MSAQRKTLKVFFASSEIAPFAKTGGLADAVVEVDLKKEKGTDFTFTDYNPDALWEAIEKDLQCFADRELWRKLIHRLCQRIFPGRAQQGNISGSISV